MTATEFFLYLIYGYAMLTMGNFAIRQKDLKLTNIYLIKSLRYLGCFGVIHGISEWLSMIIKLEFYPDLYLYLYNINLVIKAISFAFLLYFGLDLLSLRDKFKRIILKIPLISFLIYLGGFILLIVNFGLDYHLINSKFNIIIMRYAMGFSSCLISALALFINAWSIEKHKSLEISKRYKYLAWVFIVYGFMEGVLVSKANFFPANIINKELFIEFFHFIPLYIKAFIGFVIIFFLMKVIETFSWEQEEKLSRLEKLKIASEERRKLGIELHDSIIQKLYSVGLKIEYLSKNKNGDRTKDILEEIKKDLNDTIKKTREFISSNAIDELECEDLEYNLEQLVQKFNQNQSIKINLNCKICLYSIGHLSSEKSTQIYYIIQEALTNVIKHSEADYANVLLEGRHDFLYITVIDNGKGISPKNLNSQQKFGIQSMKERTKLAGGLFAIEKIKNGTQIRIQIPWEEIKK